MRCLILSRKRQKTSYEIGMSRSVLTDAGLVQFTTQWPMTTWNKQTSIILARKPVAGKSSKKLQTIATKLTCCDSFYLKGLVSFIGILLLKFRLLHFRDMFFETMRREVRKRKSRVLHGLHLYLHLTLSFWKFRNRVCSPAITGD